LYLLAAKNKMAAKSRMMMMDIFLYIFLVEKLLVPKRK
jgi:hypothetical protein